MVRRRPSTSRSVDPSTSARSRDRPVRSTGIAPSRWEEVYELIEKWRANHPAPVDTIGCQQLGDHGQDEKTYRFQTLMALMLSSQTRDEMTAAAMQALKETTGTLTATALDALPEPKIRGCISKVSFFSRKAEYMKKTARILLDQYDGDIPKTIEELKALPGVGPKMGFLALNVAWGLNHGIGVDVHVHRISNRLGWVKTKEPEETRLALENWLPKEKWPDINMMLVGFGQVQCRAVKPKCQECPVGKGLCPSYKLKW